MTSAKIGPVKGCGNIVGNQHLEQQSLDAGAGHCP